MSGAASGMPGGGVGGSLSGAEGSNSTACAAYSSAHDRAATVSGVRRRKFCTMMYSLLAFDDGDRAAGPQDVDGARATIGGMRDDRDHATLTALDARTVR